MNIRLTFRRQILQLSEKGWLGYFSLKMPRLENRFLRHPFLVVFIWIPLFPLLLIRNLVRSNGVRSLPELHKRLRQALDPSQRIEFGDPEVKKLIERAQDAGDPHDLGAEVRELLEGSDRYPDSLDISGALSAALWASGRHTEMVAEDRRGSEIQDKESEAKGLTRLGVRILDPSWSGAVGHISILGQLAQAQELGWLTDERRVVIANRRDTANLAYLRYLEEYFPIVFLEVSSSDELRRTLWPIYEYLQMIRFRDGPVDYWSAISSVDEEWNRQARAPLLSLKEMDRARSEPIFRAWGMPEGSWFVCFHIRQGPHSDRRSGNADPLTYLSAMKEVVRRGGFAIRMGNPAMTPLPKLAGVIDYAHAKDRTDWLDVALWAQCTFFVGTNSGPLGIPASFGVPTLSTNVNHLGLVPSMRNSMFIPKLCSVDGNRNPISFSRLLDMPHAWTSLKQHAEVNVRLIDNSPDELRLAVIEMFEALQHSENSFGRNADQLVFDQIRSSAGGIGTMPIAQSFLAVHRGLLG